MLLSLCKQDVISTAAEFVGTALFQLVGGSADMYGAFANGLTLAVLVYLTAPVGAGHLNPLITLSLIGAGHFKATLGLLYIIAQISGAIAGAALQLGMVPHGNPANLGCFDAANGASRAQVVLWELFGCYILVTVVHNVCCWRRSFGAIGPFVIGASLTAVALTGGQWTGSALNAARVLGPAIVNGCRWGMVGYYILGQFVAMLLATGTSILVDGPGPLYRATRHTLREQEQPPVLVRGSMAPGVMSTASAGQNESRLAESDLAPRMIQIREEV